jgi:hypothetical protein
MRWGVVAGIVAGIVVLFGGGILVGNVLLDEDPEPQAPAPLESPTRTPDESPSPSPTPTIPPLPSPTASVESSPVLVGNCSAKNLGAAIEAQPKLPVKIDRTRIRIWAAARACDFDSLDSLAREMGERFSYSFGADDILQPGEFAAHLKREDRRFDTMRVMAQILESPHCTLNDVGEGETIYAWPKVYCEESPSNADWALLEGIYTPEEIQQQKDFGHYLLYRVGIKQNGDWIFFIAGD